MKTQLPTSIKTVEEAKQFLFDLHNNDESFHPEDDANEVVWVTCNPTAEEKTQLNKLMDEVFYLMEMSEDVCFDPCGYLLDLDKARERNEFRR
jgi:hypothetical protein